MKAAIYARVSTTDQNCELQLRELREYCERRDWTIFKEYVDTGWSGSKRSRPALDQLMKDASQHRFDCVLVWKLDRFGRSVLNLVESLNSLASCGVRFVATSQSIDTDQSNPTSKLLLWILAAVAEFEREMIRERVTAGMKTARERGTKSGRAIGRPRVICDRLKIREMARTGKSVRAIAACLHVSKSIVGRVLSQKVA